MKIGGFLSPGESLHPREGILLLFSAGQRVEDLLLEGGHPISTMGRRIDLVQSPSGPLEMKRCDVVGMHCNRPLGRLLQVVRRSIGYPGGGEMVRQELHLPWSMMLHRQCHPSVKVETQRLRLGVVDDPPHQFVADPVGAGLLDEEPPADQIGHRFHNLGLATPVRLEDLGKQQLAVVDRDQVERSMGVIGQPFEAMPDQGVDRGRQRQPIPISRLPLLAEPVPFVQGPQGLDDEEGNPAGFTVDPLGELGTYLGDTQDASDQLLGLRRGARGQGDPVTVAEAVHQAQQLPDLAALPRLAVPIADRQQERMPGDPPGQLAQSLNGVLVGPMDVFENHQRRPETSGRLERQRDGLVHPLPLVVAAKPRLRLGFPLGERRNQGSQMLAPHRLELLGEMVGSQRAHPGTEGLGDR